MLDNSVIDLAHRQIQLACEKQLSDLEFELSSISANAAQNGMLRSSTHILEIQNAYANATTERGNFAWEILHRCITTIGISYDDQLEQQLKAAIEKHLPEHMDGLKYRVQQAADQFGMSDIVSRIPDKVEEARQHVRRTIYSEIELFILKLKTKPVELPYLPQINIHNSNIGALQTGTGSVANISQTINTKAIEEISNALIYMGSELKTVESLPQNDKSEIIELIVDGIDELKKEKPNLSKIKSYVSTIGGAVSFAANLRPAYESLKAAAAMIGLQLP